MEFAAFAECAADVEAEPADLEIVALVTDLFRDADADLEVVARFVQGRVFPGHSERKLDIGPSLCYRAIAEAAGPNVSVEDVEDQLASVGDVGEVAAGYDYGGQGLAAFGEGGADPLTVTEVAERLDELAAAEGPGSVDTKVGILFALLDRCSPREARYLVRLVLSEMRIGVGEGTVRDAIASAFDVPVDRVERALQVSNDYGRVAAVARDDGVAGLDEMRLEVGRPVKAMLAQAGTVSEALESWERAAVEWKFDGARVQLHHDADEAKQTGEDGGNGGGTTRVYSRNMEDVTAALPEIVEFAEANLTGSAIVDGEVVAVDDAGDPLPFQEVLRRFRRKHEVESMREEVAVEFRAFDCLHADGDDLLDEPLVERHRRLDAALDAGVADLKITDDPDRIAAVERAALEAGHEGIMLKDPDAAYTPGRRGKAWLKRKPDVETLDLVVTGAEWGEGRRASFLGTFLLSARVDDAGTANGEDPYETIGKVATGVTDEQLAELTDLLEPHVRRETGQTVEIEPAVVFEVGYEEIQPSPTYSSGYALRFPRFLAVREDLDPEEADSLERVERLAESQ